MATTDDRRRRRPQARALPWPAHVALLGAVAIVSLLVVLVLR